MSTLPNKLHAEKRKAQSSAFTMNVLVQLEEFVDSCLDSCIGLLDRGLAAVNSDGKEKRQGKGKATVEMAEVMQLVRRRARAHTRAQDRQDKTDSYTAVVPRSSHSTPLANLRSASRSTCATKATTRRASCRICWPSILAHVLLVRRVLRVSVDEVEAVTARP